MHRGKPVVVTHRPDPGNALPPTQQAVPQPPLPPPCVCASARGRQRGACSDPAAPAAAGGAEAQRAHSLVNPVGGAAVLEPPQINSETRLPPPLPLLLRAAAVVSNSRQSLSTH